MHIILNSFPHFLISEFDSLYSDAHCPISLTINLCPLKEDNHEQINQNTPQTKLWDDQKRELFIENLNNDEVARISSNLDSVSSQDNINLDDINAIVNHIENLFTSNSKATFGVKKQRKTKTNKTNNKPWFNFECHRARNEYHKIRKQ